MFVNAIYQQKLEFIRDRHVVVWRFHDNLHRRQRDMSAVGLAEALGWQGPESKNETRV
jgi:hypothetical protein